MGSSAPPVPMDPVREALTRVHGQDPHDLQALIGRILSYIHFVLPDPPVSRRATLRARRPHDDVDRVSALPDMLLRDIISRLPDKDAARTAVLGTRWRGLWRSAPLVLVDSHLLTPAAAAAAAASGDQVARNEAGRVTAAVSRVLAAHPGPFRCVHLTSSYMEEFRGPLTRWLELLAANGIQELVLISRRWPLDIVIPATFLDMATLTSLYLGLWKFPDTADLPRASSFPNLRELGLCGIFMKSEDLDYILDRSPVLETLYVETNLFKLRLRLVSQSLRCVLLIGCFFEEIFVVDAPSLERLILSEACIPNDSCTKVKIGYAPKLHLLGCLELDPGTQVLEVGNTVIKGTTRVSLSTMVPSVRILALEVCFGVRNDAKMIPSILRCFPSVETLHIKSGDTDQSTGKLNLKFWHESGTIECIQASIKLLILHGFRGDRNELAFLRYFLESALALREVVILVATSFTSIEEVQSKVASLRFSSVLVTSCSDPEGGYTRSIKRGSDFSLGDPFANY